LTLVRRDPPDAGPVIQIPELVKHTYKPRSSPEEIEERANSIFLLQCDDVVEQNAEWVQL
jgi:hypothetical protein